jgi:hypothetical protein
MCIHIDILYIYNYTRCGHHLWCDWGGSTQKSSPALRLKTKTLVSSNLRVSSHAFGNVLSAKSRKISGGKSRVSQIWGTTVEHVGFVASPLANLDQSHGIHPTEPCAQSFPQLLLLLNAPWLQYAPVTPWSGMFPEWSLLFSWRHELICHEADWVSGQGWGTHITSESLAVAGWTMWKIPCPFSCPTHVHYCWLQIGKKWPRLAPQSHG